MGDWRCEIDNKKFDVFAENSWRFPKLKVLNLYSQKLLDTIKISQL